MFRRKNLKKFVFQNYYSQTKFAKKNQLLFYETSGKQNLVLLAAKSIQKNL